MLQADADDPARLFDLPTEQRAPLRRVEKVPEIENVQSELVSEDGHAALVTFDVKGDSDDEIRSYLVSRFGRAILLRRAREEGERRGRLAAIGHRDLPVFGMQFHPEVTHTPLGRQVLHNFVIGVCGCATTACRSVRESLVASSRNTRCEYG